MLTAYHDIEMFSKTENPSNGPHLEWDSWPNKGYISNLLTTYSTFQVKTTM